MESQDIAAAAGLRGTPPGVTKISGTSALLFVLTVGVVDACIVAGVWFAWDRSLRAAIASVAVISAWLAFSFWVATTGVLQNLSEFPPPFMLFMAPCTVATALIAFSSLGSRLIRTIPVVWLIGYQAFRIPVE